jgi:hypothetical protein
MRGRARTHEIMSDFFDGPTGSDVKPVRPLTRIGPLAIVALLLALASSAAAQENFEIQVYGSETVAPRATMIELHTSSAIRGTTRREDGVLPTQGAVHETLEVTHGWTPWFETGFYLFTSIQPDGGWEWVGNHLRPRVRAPEDWRLPVGLSLSLEVGYQQRRFSTDTWTLEVRPIIDKQLGPWYVSFNPAFGRSLRGEGVKQGRGFEFAPSAKVAYDVTDKVTLGLEYYGGLGPVSAFDPLRQQQHLIFPVIDLNLGPKWEFNAGVGFGLTPATDGVILKLILGYRFDFASGGR